MAMVIGVQRTNLLLLFRRLLCVCGPGILESGRLLLGGLLLNLLEEPRCFCPILTLLCRGLIL